MASLREQSCGNCQMLQRAASQSKQLDSGPATMPIIVIRAKLISFKLRHL